MLNAKLASSLTHGNVDNWEGILSILFDMSINLRLWPWQAIFLPLAKRLLFF